MTRCGVPANSGFDANTVQSANALSSQVVIPGYADHYPIAANQRLPSATVKEVVFPVEAKGD